MASPITPFVAIRAFAGVPIEDLDINRSPVETVFQGILVFTTLFLVLEILLMLRSSKVIQINFRSLFI